MPIGMRNNMPMRYSLQIGKHRKLRKFTQQTLADELGVEQPTIQRWESGQRTPDAKDLVRLANALGIEPGDLYHVPEAKALGPKIPVRGAVGAGLWREAFEWAEDDWRDYHGRPDITVPISHRFALDVVGDSMNLLYPHGSTIECVSVFGGGEIAPGKRVVILRRREDLEYEATVKELVEQDGRLWAAPRSSNPAFTAFPLDENEPGILETRIIAIVVGSFRPE